MASVKLSKLQEAIRWASKLHRGQDRDGPSPLPYISHPIDVMNLLRYVAKVTDEDLLAVAVLHDIVEECGVESSEIEKRFGKRIESLVRELTRREPSEAETAGMSDLQIAELRNRILLEEVAALSHEARIIKLADRLSNLRSALVTRSGNKLNRYVEQSEQILKLIPRNVSPSLWQGIKDLLSG